jgi:hypothetical protein
MSDPDKNTIIQRFDVFRSTESVEKKKITMTTLDARRDAGLSSSVMSGRSLDRLRNLSVANPTKGDKKSVRRVARPAAKDAWDAERPNLSMYTTVEKSKNLLEIIVGYGQK